MRISMGQGVGGRLARYMTPRLAEGATRENRSSGKLRSSIVSVASLSALDIDTMWRLYERYYADVTHARFLSDLNEKQHVILLRDTGSQAIEGFSTVKLIKGVSDQRPYVAVYSGDTIVSKPYWGQTSLQQTFFLLLLRVYVTHPGHDVYWFLISKGYKTYLLLANNFPNCWPRVGCETPAAIGGILDTLSRTMFGAAWHPELGVLKFDSKLGCLKAGVAPVDVAHLEDANIRFFVESNPYYHQGDELCCIGRVDRALLAYYPIKLIKKKMATLIPAFRA